MSQEIVKTELEGFSGPHNHRLLAALNRAWDSRENDSKYRTPDSLFSLLKKISRFSELKEQGIYVTKDGYRWFFGALFDCSDSQNQLLILFPWSRDKDKKDSSQMDRSIGVYTKGTIDQTKLTEILRSLIRTFEPTDWMYRINTLDIETGTPIKAWSGGTGNVLKVRGRFHIGFEDGHSLHGIWQVWFSGGCAPQMYLKRSAEDALWDKYLQGTAEDSEKGPDQIENTGDDFEIDNDGTISLALCREIRSRVNEVCQRSFITHAFEIAHETELYEERAERTRKS